MAWAEIQKAEQERQDREAARLAKIERDKEAQREKERAQEVDRLKLSADRQREAGPAERMLPGEAERIREAAKLKEPTPEQEREQEATRMEYQPAGLQMAPSMGGQGVRFVNKRVQEQEPKRETLLAKLEREAAERGEKLEVKISNERDMSIGRNRADEWEQQQRRRRMQEEGKR